MGGFEPLEKTWLGLEGRLRYRQRVGAKRIPSSVAERVLALLEMPSLLEKNGMPDPSLGRVAAELEGCTKCALHRGRKSVVVGEGNPEARLLFVGEGPGEEEDIQGRPFVGAAGKLLDRIIEAMDLRREEVYIANVVKCRPPANRTPKPEEVEACIPFLRRQIRAVSPTVICTLGGVATQALLETGEGITRLRGRFRDWEGIRVMPTYHPSYLLRYPSKKRDVWEDVKRVMAFLRGAVDLDGEKGAH